MRRFSERHFMVISTGWESSGPYSDPAHPHDGTFSVEVEWQDTHETDFVYVGRATYEWAKALMAAEDGEETWHPLTEMPASLRTALCEDIA